MNKSQQGLTLIEMMIAMVIGLLIVGTVITIFITNVRSNRDNVAMIRLNQELRGVMTFVSDELKRGGYSNDSEEDAFIDEFAVIGGSCVRYSYDENSDGVLNTTGTDKEHFGFRLNANVIEWSRDNSAGACDSTSWQGITEDDIADITDFTITSSDIPTIDGTVNIKQLTISITGETSLSGGTTASRTISEVIRLRNEDEI